MRENGVNWRPHVKCPKVPAIAHRLLDAGAIGVTCAKLGEAEVMGAAGIRNILIANQVVGPTKISRLVNLLPSAKVIVAVDNAENVSALDAAARAKGVQLEVVIEVNTGMDRAGVEPGAPVIDLASAISKSQGLEFAGVMAWEAHTIRIADPIEKERKGRRSGEKARRLRRAMPESGNAGRNCQLRRHRHLPVQLEATRRDRDPSRRRHLRRRNVQDAHGC